jgi:hypothetical protein
MTTSTAPTPFARAVAAIDDANRRDPNSVLLDGMEQPAELVYSQRMSETLDRFCPYASEELRLAARAQHIERWITPRADFPMDRVGYLKWRTQLKRHHGSRLEAIMIEAGYDQETAGRAASLVRKEGLKSNPETQALEDVICLVFLEHYAEAFASGHDDDKVVSIIQKTWRKMSPAGHEKAQSLELPERLGRLVGRALERTAA